MPLVFGEVDLARGVADDNRSGVILTKIAQGDWVRVPFGQGVQLVAAGSATAGTTTSNNGNPDGSNTGSTLTVPSGTGNSASVRATVYGRVVGVRFQRNTSSNPPFTLKVDGVVYPIKNTQGRRHAQTASITDVEALFVPAIDLLNDGPHTVEISLAADPSSSRSIVLYGLIAEASKGYSVFPSQGLIPVSPTAVTTSAVSLSGANNYAVSKLCFYNTTAATRTVTIKDSSSNTFRIITLAATGTAGDYGEHDFGNPTYVNNMKVQADAVGVNMWIQQGARTR